MRYLIHDNSAELLDINTQMNIESQLLLYTAFVGAFPIDSMIVAMAITFGCFLQLIGGIGAFVQV